MIHTFPNLAIVFALTISGAMSWTMATVAIGDDEVVVRLNAPSQKEVSVRGTIVDLTGKAVTIRRGGRVEMLATDRIVRWKTDRQAAHQQADKKFESKDYRGALDAYERAVRGERRIWMQRIILGRCVQCYKNLGRHEEAIDMFLIIADSDPTTQLFAGVPVPWRTMSASPAVTRKVIAFIGQTEKREATRLIGASWLLATDRQSDAVNVLRSLLSSQNPYVASVAEAQLWRAAVAKATDKDRSRWRQRITQMPQDIRSGPYFVLGQAEGIAGNHEAAALDFMRVPIHDVHARELAAQSLLLAGENLEQINRNQEASRLFREASEQYTGTMAARMAETKLTPRGNE